jgi:hypothetical protein
VLIEKSTDVCPDVSHDNLRLWIPAEDIVHRLPVTTANIEQNGPWFESGHRPGEVIHIKEDALVESARSSEVFLTENFSRYLPDKHRFGPCLCKAGIIGRVWCFARVVNPDVRE